TPSRAGDGHSSEIANRETADATPHPATRSGIDETAPGSDTGRMSESSNAVVAPARTELSTPANRTAKASAAVTTAASQVVREARVPMQMKAAQASASAV